MTARRQQRTPPRRRKLAPLAAALLLYQRGMAGEEIDLSAEEEGDEGEAWEGRVRCPLCAWRPSASSLWLCADSGHPEYFYGGCGSLWNTFDTRGRCPGCGHRWRWTACHRCDGWSPHEDWYAAERA